jgi:hypothetical protein
LHFLHIILNFLITELCVPLQNSNCIYLSENCYKTKTPVNINILIDVLPGCDGTVCLDLFKKLETIGL